MRSTQASKEGGGGVRVATNQGTSWVEQRGGLKALAWLGQTVEADSDLKA